MSRYSFEVSTDGRTTVQVGLCPSNGEAIVKGRELLVRRAAAMGAGFGHCAVRREARDKPKPLGIWRYAQHSPQPVWESAATQATTPQAQKIERFLREAQAAEAIARSLNDPDLRRGFEDLARQWRELERIPFSLHRNRSWRSSWRTRLA